MNLDGKDNDKTLLQSSFVLGDDNVPAQHLLGFGKKATDEENVRGSRQVSDNDDHDMSANFGNMSKISSIP